MNTAVHVMMFTGGLHGVGFLPVLINFHIQFLHFMSYRLICCPSLNYTNHHKKSLKWPYRQSFSLSKICLVIEWFSTGHCQGPSTKNNDTYYYFCHLIRNLLVCNNTWSKFVRFNCDFQYQWSKGNCKSSYKKHRTIPNLSKPFEK